MFREYRQFLRNYQNLTQLPPRHLWTSLLSAILARVSALLLPLFAAFIIDDLTVKDIDATYAHLAVFTIVFVFYYLMVYFHNKVYGIGLNNCYDRLQTQLLDKLMTVDNDFLRQMDKGSVINTVHDYLIEIAETNTEIADFVARTIQVMLICAIIGYYSIPIMLLMILFVLIYLAASQYVDRRYNYYRRKNITHDNTYSNFTAQALNGLQELRGFNILAKFQNRISLLQRKFDADYSHQSRYAILRDNDVLAFQYILQFVAYIILILMAADQQVAVGIMVMIVTYQTQLFTCARHLTKITTRVRETQNSVDSVRRILEYRPSQPTHFGDLLLNNISGQVTFRHVYFRNDRVALRDINLTLRPHQFTAIVGPPGSGKSELFDLLLRLEQPTRGRITIDDINIKRFSAATYSENVTVADQTPFLFDASIRRNLSFVDPDIEHQVEACKIVGIHDFIESLPAGYHTVLRKNAHSISGGQRQMISIARTILSRAEILLFDGTASSLDSAAVAQLLRAITKLKRSHTIVMITRRPDLMTAADRIIVLNNGKVIDSGTHAGLLKRCRVYRDLIQEEANV